jgi:succinyl-diaminopimelate desuccinylase
MKNETLELAKALIRRKSITPADEGCQQLIIDRLVPLGFKAETLKCGDVTNLWIRHGTERPLVVLAGHTDVVPPGPREKWTSDPFEPTIRDGKLFGRGAADMKTSIAAFVTAAERFVPRIGHPAPWAAHHLDQEAQLGGAAPCAWWAFKARGRRSFLHRGRAFSGGTLRRHHQERPPRILTGRLVVHRNQGHVAYHNVKNPIHLVAPAIAEISTAQWDGATGSSRRRASRSPTSGGTGARHVQVDFNFRFSTESTPESLQSRVKKILDQHGLEYDVDWVVGGKPFLTKRGRLVTTLTNAIRKVSGVTPEVNCTGGTSDGRFIIDVCPEVAEFGPVNRSIHKVNEAVALEEIEPLADVYRTAIEDLLLPH